MENRHATKLEEMEKRQHDIQERLTQMMEMLTSPKREKWIDDDPNLQERPKHWKMITMKGASTFAHTHPYLNHEDPLDVLAN